MRRSIDLAASLIILILLSSSSFAATYNVTPGNFIQDAIDSATHGDTIIVARGIYRENVHFHGKNIVLIGSDPDSSIVVETTIIDGSDSGTVVSFDGSETSACVLSGFTIINGHGQKGGGIYGGEPSQPGKIGSRAKIRNNIIIYNSAPTGSGGGIANCDGVIEGNIISHNTANSAGGGIWHSDGVIQKNIVSFNSSGYQGGGLCGCFGTIQNNFVYGNSTAQLGGGINKSLDTNSIIRNNTVIGNSSGNNGGGLCDCNGIIEDCIIRQNTAPNGPQLYASSEPSYSCIEGWAGGGEGNISSDPQFVGTPYDSGTWTADAAYDSSTYKSMVTDTGASWEVNSLRGMFLNPDTSIAVQYFILSNTDTTITVFGDLSDSVDAGDSYEMFDYHLQSFSACVDAGNMFVNAGEDDLDGNPRYVDASDSSGWDGTIKGIVVDDDDTVHIGWALIDIGAYEHQSACTALKFTVQSRDALDSGGWQNRYTGLAGTWTDTEAAGIGKRFYRVVGDYAVEQSIVDITAEESLAMLDERHGERCFAVLDVRRPGEYAQRHIIGAINIDYYSSTFEEELNALDKGKAYLVHCHSGGRSATAVQTMETLGFIEVYNMLGGMLAFEQVTGAEAYLEP